MEPSALSSTAVRELVCVWFRKLTDHAPVSELLAMLDTERLNMVFPEATLTSEADFRTWYRNVTHRYFDQVHDLVSLEIVPRGQTAAVSLIVSWQARTWAPPAGYSQWQGVYAHQQWLVGRSPANSALRISSYVVTGLEPMASDSRAPARALPTRAVQRACEKGPQPMDTREIVDKYFEYVNSGRWDDYLGLFADGIVMDEQLLGRIEGKAKLAEGIAGLRDNRQFRNFPLEKVIDGDQAMVSWNIKSPRPDGSVLDVKGVNYYRMRDGKIVYFANFHDTAPFRP